MSENQTFSEVFRGHRNVSDTGLKWVKIEFCYTSETFSEDNLIKNCRRRIKLTFCLMAKWINHIKKMYSIFKCTVPASNYLLKVNNRNTRARFELCSMLTIKTLERCHWRHSGVFIVNFEHISHLVLVFLLSTLSR